MNRPPLKTMALGHPVPAFAICSVASLLLYQWAMLQTTEAGIVGLAAGAIASWSLKANEARGKYLNWQRQWAAMEGTGPHITRLVTVLKGLTIGTVLTVMLLVALTSDHADITIVGTIIGLLVLAGMAGVLILIGKLLARLRPKRRQRAHQPVRVVISRPVLAVPRLDRAYAALPPYCHALLRQKSINP